MAELDLFAVTAPGLGDVAASELRGSGIRRVVVQRGGVAWRGDVASMQRANLELRSVTRVLVRIARFHAESFHELERRARSVPWNAFAGTGSAVRFRVTSHASRLYHTDAVAERLARAAMRAGLVPEVTSVEDGDISDTRAQLFVVRIARDVVTVSADSSGELLHRRGYRLAVAKAPLRETIAAAMLLAAGYDGSGPLVDPLCGSGTIAIEGALIARRIPPGASRRFAFMEWPGFEGRDWDRIRDEALARARAVAPAPIVATDRDAGAVRATGENAARAGVAGDVVASVRALSAAVPPQGATGWLVTNPPYGERVGRDVRNLYARLGQLARGPFRGWVMGVLAHDPTDALRRQIGVPLERAFETSNGGIHVKYLVGRAAG